MKVLSLVLVLVFLFAGAAFAGPRVDLLDDCDFYRPAMWVLSADTLWFTKGVPVDTYLAAANAADWFAPAYVPVGNYGDGEVRLERRPVRRVLAYSREPFFAWSFNGGSSNSTVYTVVDTIGMTGGAPHSGEFPCWTLFAYPDSIRFKEAGSDSVHVWIGY